MPRLVLLGGKKQVGHREADHPDREIDRHCPGGIHRNADAFSKRDVGTRHHHHFLRRHAEPEHRCLQYKRRHHLSPVAEYQRHTAYSLAVAVGGRLKKTERGREA